METPTYTEAAFDIYTPPPDNLDDPHSVQTRDLAIAFERARARLTYKRAQFLEYHFKGYGSTKAAEMAGLASQGTIIARVKDPESPEAKYLAILRQVYMLNMGPTIEQRKAMLWSIANKHQHKNPGAAIKAVDTLNRMDNVYQVDDHGSTVVNQTNIYNDVNWEDVATVAAAARAAKEAKTLEHNPCTDT